MNQLWTAITKYHRLCNLTTGSYFLTFVEPGKSGMKVPTNLVLGKESLPDFQMAPFFLSLHKVGRVGRGRRRMVERKKGCFLVPVSIRPLILSSQGHC